MKTIRWIACSTVAISILLLQSCGVKGTNESQTFHIAMEPPAATFASLYANVLQTRCLSCHGDFQTEAGFFPLRVLAYEKVRNGSMPPGGPALTANLVDQLKAYVDQQVPASAPESAPTPTQAPTPDVIPRAPRYSFLRDRLFAPSCVRCHNANIHRGHIDLSTLESVRTHSSLILEVLQDGSMPPEGETPIPSPETIAAYRDWVEHGFPR